ncbi:plasmid stabilization system, partial [Chryseobacterium sp. HMWF035]
PNAFVQHEVPFREVYMKTFPFLVIYETESSKILIHSVFHIRQNPEKKVSSLL